MKGMQCLRLFLPVAYMLMIYGLSSVPDTGAPETALQRVLQWVSPSWQNLLHIPLYAGLCFAWFWALAGAPLSFKQRSCIAATIAVAFGGFDEWHQLAVPGRFGSLTDLLLNGAGVLLCVVGVALFHRW